LPHYNGVEELFFTENLEDREDFEPFVYIDVTKHIDVWLKMVSCYEQFKTSNALTFSYINSYQKLEELKVIFLMLMPLICLII